MWLVELMEEAEPLDRAVVVFVPALAALMAPVVFVLVQVELESVPFV